MKKCRKCGAKLSYKATKEQKEVAEKNIRYFTMYLEEEGEYLPVNQKKSIERILYESRLALNDECSFEDALCDKCRKEEAKGWDRSGFGISNGKSMSRDELERIKMLDSF